MDPVSSARPRERPAVALAVGDITLLVAVVTAGAIQHGEDPVREPLAVAETVAPFLVGWLVVAWLLGVYESPRMEPLPAARRILGTWLGAANVGLILRASPLFEGGITWPFPLVITGFAGLALVGWRILAAWWLGRRETRRAESAAQS